MSPRPYRLGKREVAIEETRKRVIAAARDVFREAGFDSANLASVAKRAGVARATVYYQFKSKLGLIDAVITHTLQRERARGLQRARERADAAAGIRMHVREICKFWAGDFLLYRNVIGLAAVDREAAVLIDGYDDTRRELLTWPVERLADQGRLRDGVSQREAVDLLWLATSFRSFDHLYSRAGLSVRAAVAILVRMTDSIIADGSSAATTSDAAG